MWLFLTPSATDHHFGVINYLVFYDEWSEDVTATFFCTVPPAVPTAPATRNEKQEKTSWAQRKNGGRFKLFVKKNEAKIFKRTFKAIKSIRELRLFTKNCGQVSSLLGCAWFFCSLVRLCFPSIPVGQVNCLCSLEKILHFCENLNYSS